MDAKEKCKKLYSNGWWVRAFTNIRFWTSSFVQIEQFVPKTGKILDLGCGYGIFANYLALSSSKRSVLGVDTDKTKIKNAKRGVKNTSFRVGDATLMKLSNLNCILLLDVLHHLVSYKDQEILIGNCEKMLTQDGVLIISDVDCYPFWKLVLARLTDFFMYKGAPVYYRYKKNMVKLLQKHFNNVRFQSLQNNPFPHVLYVCQKR